MGTLSASIFAADLADLAAQVRLVEPHADEIHVDITDGHFVAPLTVGPVVVASLRRRTRLPLDAHLMVDWPAGLFDELAEAGADVVDIHVEAVEDPAPVIEKAKGAGMRVGLAVSPRTPVEAVYPFLDELDRATVTAVAPAWPGRAFLPEALPKVEALRGEVERRRGSAQVAVEGGVTLDNAVGCVDAGANVLVVASAIFGAPDAASAARRLESIVGPA